MDSMADKYVELKGEELDLCELSRRFRTESVSVTKIAGRYILRAANFVPLIGHTDIRKQAEILLKKINGAMKIMIQDYQPVEIQSIAEVDEMGRTAFSGPSSKRWLSDISTAATPARVSP